MTKYMRICFKVFILSGLLSYSAVFADVWDKLDAYSDDYQFNEDVEDFVWKEGSSNLPGYPQDSDLLKVAGPAAYRDYQFFIDEKSLTVGSDGVVRYSIVIRSASGSDNVMYDGLRCSTNQLKNYAYGSTDMDGKKKFIKKQSSDWHHFRGSGITGYGSILASNYFCDHNGAVLKQNNIIQNIKYGKGPVDGIYN